jgi:hypothetical protein
VPDQTRSLIKHPDRYDPVPNRLYEQFAQHYSTAILAARPAHPRDKPKVEAAVLLVQRWILARLRNRRFFSMGELNQAIAVLLEELNRRPFKKLPGCRRSAFEQLDAPLLQPLPPRRFAISRWKQVKVNIFCGLAISVAVAARCGLQEGLTPAEGHKTYRYSERRNSSKSEPILRRGVLPAGSSCATARAFISRSICA